MDFFSILTLLGGLAMFLYGMQVMGDGLEKLSGGKLEKILENLSSNRLKAVLVGAAVTAVIQSSSATTVMVVGFVNSGIMHLSQAVGFIMGANIGTTITAWILSLAGIESSNFFVKLLNPSSFSPILALVGVIFIVFLHNEKKKDIGNIMVGFAVLMFGMNTMSGAVIFVITLSSFVTSVIYKLILQPLDLTYLQTIVFILIIAALVQFVEMFLKKSMPSLYKALGVYLPLITTNCAVLGVALTNVQKDYNILEGTVNGFATAFGFSISIVLMAGIREKIAYNDIPEAFQGFPTVLLTAGLMAIAFFGFSGLI